ncbi:MAG: hypothetical protein ACYDEO_15290 [Aggregatilineales bacterium]
MRAHTLGSQIRRTHRVSGIRRTLGRPLAAKQSGHNFQQIAFAGEQKS